MKLRPLLIVAVLALMCSCTREKPQLLYMFEQFDLGEIKPEGWLLDMMDRQRNGLTGKLDEVYPEVVGARNGWLGGDGDQWERGPYWIDGALPTAYIMDDEALKAKVQPWIEWALASQREDGQFGPTTDYKEREPGLQRTNSEDWWPRMVMLKVMQQYYSATKDERVIPFLTKYFRYQLETLPQKPLGNWTYWATYRYCDNEVVALWLYNQTGDEFLLDLVKLLHEQGVDMCAFLSGHKALYTFDSIHCVNLAQAIKEPAVYSQLEPSSFEALTTGLEDLRRWAGQPNGMFGGDECYHGANPTLGSELCSAVEFMYSMEEAMRIVADCRLADQLEKVAFNALPTQISDDFMSKQYYQQVNQVLIKDGYGHNFTQKQEGTAISFGTLSGYPCCLCNFHQGWPKFVQNLYLKTPSRKGETEGIALMAYAPSQLSTCIGNTPLTISEETVYPFDGKIRLHISTEADGVTFRLYLRIPGWAEDATIEIGGKTYTQEAGTMFFTDRGWSDGDVVTINFPMSVKMDRWYENSVAIERGPLTYALKMEEKWDRHQYARNQFNAPGQHGDYCWEVSSTTPWNYGLVKFNESNISEKLSVKIDSTKLFGGQYFWNQEGAPIQITAKARRIKSWELYGGEAGPVPSSPYKFDDLGPEEEISLIPYGCTSLRITEFPMLR